LILRVKHKKILGFFVSNSLAAIVNIFLRHLLFLFVGENYAIFFGNLSGLIISYLLCKKYVFKGSRKIMVELFSFSLINISKVFLIYTIYIEILDQISNVNLNLYYSNFFRSFVYSSVILVFGIVSFFAQKGITFRDYTK
tara:strand:+ start:526 stop:945 length:420 start_codon:yes stop_codon:yes gene_type:complete